MLRQKTRKKTRKIAQFINLLVIEPGRPAADFFCIVVLLPRPIANRHPAMLWTVPLIRIVFLNIHEQVLLILIYLLQISEFCKIAKFCEVPWF